MWAIRISVTWKSVSLLMWFQVRSNFLTRELRQHNVYVLQNHNVRSCFKRWQLEAAQCLADFPHTFIISYVPTRKIASCEEIIVCVTSLRLDRPDCWKRKCKCMSRIHPARKLCSKSLLWFSSKDAFLVWGKCFYFRVAGVWSYYLLLYLDLTCFYLFIRRIWISAVVPVRPGLASFQ